MRVTEKLVKSPEEEGVTLAYIRLTKDFEEIKEYVQHKGDTLTGYKKARERASVRIEDILYLRLWMVWYFHILWTVFMK